MDTSLDIELIEGTIIDLTGVIEGLEARLGAIDHQRSAVEKQIADTRGRRAGWEAILQKHKASGQPKARARKGRNASMIELAYCAAPEGHGFTMKELAESTSISWSSVRNVLTKSHKDHFQEKDGRYYMIKNITPDGPISRGPSMLAQAV
jgi:hypothetical protein